MDVSASGQPFGSGPDGCSGAFVPHELAHVTLGRGVITAMSDGTGSGVLVEDMDDDGLIDIVLPNLAGETSILWNEGGLVFDRQPLISGRFRQALAADVDADGDRDLVLTTGIGPPVVLSAVDGAPRHYQRRELRTAAIAYSAAVGDLAGDGTLRLATGSYNAELTQNRDPRVLTGNGVGAAVHRLEAGQGSASPVVSELLTDQAQALVTLVVDLDDDGRQDVMVGNDLGTPDMVWLGAGGGRLVEAVPFDTTTLSTMSIDVVDFDNDGDSDVIATDMAPMAGEDPTPWERVMPDVEAARVDDVQDPFNKLQVRDGDGYDDRAVDLGFAATGWSWSGVAGDLDNDGLLDLYVVNGMQAVAVFPDLPDGALVEANQAFRNTGDDLVPAPQWGLGDTAGGRGMAQADLDADGDLDVVVNNLGSPAKLFENDLCGGAALVVDPVWLGVQNRDALGVTIEVTAGDRVLRRQLASARGYLSSPPTEAHFGLGDHDRPVDVTITWPDGATTDLAEVEVGRRLTVERAAGPVERVGRDDARAGAEGAADGSDRP